MKREDKKKGDLIKLKVFMPCSGLGEIQRGYESFTRECFEALKNEPSLDIFLYKGGGKTVPAQQEYRLWNLKRRYKINQILAKVFRKDAYFFEQLTFFLSLIPALIKHKPQVVYLSDFLLGCWLAHLRRFLKLKYKLLFSNGAPNGPPFPLFDHVQHLIEGHRQGALQIGEPESKHSKLPYGFYLPPEKDCLLQKEQKIAIRKKLGLPENKRIVLSVGTVNVFHKRMDFLVREFANAGENCTDLYLLILGQISDESRPVINLARSLLSQEQYQIIMVPYEQVKLYYQSADLFVLCSLNEGFGRVYLEALIYGLPVIAHDFEVAREVLKQHARYLNMEVKGNLSCVLTHEFTQSSSMENNKARHQYVQQHYSWEKLQPKYVELITSCTQNE